MITNQMTEHDFNADQKFIDNQIKDISGALYHQRPDQGFETFQHHLRLGEGYMLFVEGQTDSLEAEIKWNEDIIAKISVEQTGMLSFGPYPSERIDVQYECEVILHKDPIKYGIPVKVPLATDLADAQLTNEDALPVYKLFSNAINYAKRELFSLKF